MSIPWVANSLWWVSNLGRHHRYRQALREPGRVQRQILSNYLQANADTEIGRLYRFETLHSAEKYQARVPISTYDDYVPFITRIMEGRPNVLTRDPVRRLIPSSGSTQAAKLIPYTRSLQVEFNAAIGPWMFDLYRRIPTLWRGPAYWSISPAMPTPPAEGSQVPIGFDEDSAYLGGFCKRLVDSALAVPGEVRRVQDIDSFRYVTLLLLLAARDLRLVSVWHPSFLQLLLEAAPCFWNSLLRDLHDGTLRPPSPLPVDLRKRWRRRRDLARSRELESIGPRAPQAYWPHLALISCWGDGHAALHLESLRRLFPAVPIQPKGLIATEAFVSLPYQDQHPLTLRSHVFEFLDDQGKPWLADQVRQGDTYSILVTTGGGLYRYRLGDRVQVVGWLDRTPCLRFVSREQGISDRFGEKLSEGFVSQVLLQITAQFSLTPAFMMLAPSEGFADRCYTLFIETPSPLPPALGLVLEEALRANPHYDYCVRLGQLQPVRVFQIHKAGYQTFAARCLEQGQRLGNIKPVSLSDLIGWEQRFDGWLI